MGDTLLLVDDDEGIRESLAEFLGDLGYDLCVATQEQEAWDLALARPPQVVVSDLHLGQGSGLGLLKRFKEAPPQGVEPLCILISGEGSPELASQAGRLGIHALLLKPFSLEELQVALGQGQKG